MKRIAFAVSLILLSISLFAQKSNKYARDITVTHDKFEDLTSWSSPIMGKGLSKLIEPVRFTRRAP